jgi:hypothetical protein
MSSKTYFVPAAPGFWELYLVGRDNSEYEAGRTPVVAWQMLTDDAASDDDPFYYADPVTIEYGRTRRVSTPILCPDGRVRIAGDATYSSEDAWLKAAAAKAGGRRAKPLAEPKEPT